jgi:hypothetical protein
MNSLKILSFSIMKRVALGEPNFIRYGFRGRSNSTRVRSADRGATYCAFRGDFVLVVISMAAVKELATASPDANHKTTR